MSLEIVCAPRTKPLDDGYCRKSKFGDGVINVWRHHRVHGARDKTRLLQFAQLLRNHLVRNAFQIAANFIEPPHAARNFAFRMDTQA